MRATEISQRLSEQVEGVVRHLLPRGKRQGHEWCVGDIAGNPGDSLRVHVGPGKPGVWSDFQSGESGDLIGLWMAVKAVSLADACRDALAYLGIREEAPKQAHTKAYKRPSKEGVSPLSSAHMEWLAGERRLAAGSVAAYKLASRGDRLMFPYLDPTGDLIFAKYRKLPKQFSADADCEPILFGWQAVPASAREVVICEGELDAVAWHGYGYAALSVPTGAGSHGWIEREFDRLARFDTIWLSFDMDDAGQAAIAEVCSRLGRERCFVVKLPHKDANECAIQGIGMTQIINCVREASTLDPSELRCASTFEDAVWAEFGRVDEGMLLPWTKTHDTLKLRWGETSIWAGVNGHGKSQVAANVVSWLVSHGTRACVASMEYRTPAWLAIMHKIMAGTGTPTEEYCRHISRVACSNLWTFSASGDRKAKRILEVFRYARDRYGIRLFLIDNLTKCGFADDDYAGQKRFVEELSDFDRDTGSHTMLVAHMRKAENENSPAGKMAVKGSGGITDMVDTVVEVWRNKPKEKAVRLAEESDEPLSPKIEESGDTLLLCHKQRATGIEPTIALWFDRDSGQFLGNRQHHRRPMVEYTQMVRAA
jgi:twinkle protein